MLTLSEFCNKYQGTRVDFDGYYGAQCVDLYRQYCKEVFGIPRTESVDGAKDLWYKYDLFPIEKQYLRKMAYPIASGDLVIFDATPKNPYGHVAIYIASEGDRVLVFEQDGLKQDGAKYNWRSCDGMLGVLRKKS